MQAVLVTHYKLSGQHVISQHIIAGQQRQQRACVSVQQFFSLVIQQQIAKTF